MSNSYKEINQRDAAAQMATRKDLPTAIRRMAVWVDWECCDPMIICENIARYLESNTINCKFCGGQGITDNLSSTCLKCDGTGEFSPDYRTQFLIQKQGP